MKEGEARLSIPTFLPPFINILFVITPDMRRTPDMRGTLILLRTCVYMISLKMSQKWFKMVRSRNYWTMEITIYNKDGTFPIKYNT